MRKIITIMTGLGMVAFGGISPADAQTVVGADTQYSTASYSVQPPPGPVDGLTSIKVTFDNQVLVPQLDEVAYLSIDDNAPIEVSYLAYAGYPSSGSDGSGYIVVMLGNHYTKQGTYVVTIPAGATNVTTDNDLPTPEIVLTYTIAKKNDGLEPEVAYTVRPEEGEYEFPAQKLGDITLTFEEEVFEGYQNVTVMRDNAVVPVTVDAQESMTNPMEFYIFLNEDQGVTEAGSYDIVIGEGTILYGDGSPVGEITLHYTLTGKTGSVTGVELEGEQVIYDLQGRKLRHPKHLQRGLYIVRGKKIIVR